MKASGNVKPGRNDPCPCGSGKKYKACCAQADAKFSLRQAPDVCAITQRAQQAAARADFADAEFWYRQLVAAKPNDTVALAGLGQALCWLHRRREGIGYLLQAAKQLERQAAKSRDPQLPLDLSGQLQHWGEIEAAERLARVAVRLAPRSPVALNNLVLCLIRVSRNDEALPLAQQVCEILPDEPSCNVLLAILQSCVGRRDEARTRLERVIELDQDPEQTARAYLELGTVLDKLADYEGAFAALTKAAEGHSALPQNRAADHDSIFAMLARNKAGFDRELLMRWSPASLSGDGLPAPVFLLGFLRSGTTLTEQVLGAHPAVMATDESGIVHELTQELARSAAVADDVPAALRKIGLEQARDLRRFYWTRMRDEYGEAVMHRRVVDKNALNTIELGLISVLFPEARILFALRDPRDVCLSCFMQAFTPAPATVNLLSWEGIARQYAAVMDYWLYLKDRIQPRYLELRYEDTVGDFEATYRRVFDLLGVDWHPEVIAFHEKARGRYISTPSFAAVTQPLYSSAVARWRRYEKHFSSILPRLQRFIDAFGYQ